jgi:hypothetical protein
MPVLPVWVVAAFASMPVLPVWVVAPCFAITDHVDMGASFRMWAKYFSPLHAVVLFFLSETTQVRPSRLPFRYGLPVNMWMKKFSPLWTTAGT